MNTKAKLNQRLAFSAPGTWVPMAEYRQVVAAASVAVTSPPTEVTVQLRKATSAAGANAADLGAAVTANTEAVAQASASDLGKTGSTPFTHVSATITGGGSPPAATISEIVVRGDGRFSP